ncbi:hypothetical protein [Actinomadura atramentaria]|uniref:hypothetical protein n=1 Tax=Actinomadura atramentaria TaxID=1990 RepID=UPI00039BC248|nr:hypothetical protein [Actinomadura atramentaria]
MVWGPGYGSAPPPSPRAGGDAFAAAEADTRALVAAPWWPTAPLQQRQQLIAGRVLVLPEGTGWVFGAWARWYRMNPGGRQWFLCPPPLNPATRAAARPASEVGAVFPPLPPHVVPANGGFETPPPAPRPFLGTGFAPALTDRVRATVEAAAALPAADYPHARPEFARHVPSTVVAAWDVLLFCCVTPVFDARRDAEMLDLWGPYRSRPLPKVDGPRWLTPPTLETLVRPYTERLRASRVEAAIVVLRTMWAVANALREDPRLRLRADALLEILAPTLGSPTVDYGALPYGDAAVAQQWMTRCPWRAVASLRGEMSPGDAFRHEFYSTAEALADHTGDPAAPEFVEPRLVAAALLAADLSVVRANVVTETAQWLDAELRYTVEAVLAGPGHPLRRLWPDDMRLAEPLASSVRRGGQAAEEALLAAVYAMDLAWCRAAGMPARPRGFPVPTAIIAGIVGRDRARATARSTTITPPAPPKPPQQPQSAQSRPGFAPGTPPPPAVPDQPGRPFVQPPVAGNQQPGLVPPPGAVPPGPAAEPGRAEFGMPAPGDAPGWAGYGAPGAGAPGQDGAGAPGYGVPGAGVPGQDGLGAAPGYGVPGQDGSGVAPGYGVAGADGPGAAPGYGVPGAGVPGADAPGVGAPGYGGPGQVGPGVGGLGQGTPGSGAPGHGSPGRGPGAPGAGASDANAPGAEATREAGDGGFAPPYTALGFGRSGGAAPDRPPVAAGPQPEPEPEGDIAPPYTALGFGQPGQPGAQPGQQHSHQSGMPSGQQPGGQPGQPGGPSGQPGHQPGVQQGRQPGGLPGQQGRQPGYQPGAQQGQPGQPDQLGDQPGGPSAPPQYLQQPAPGTEDDTAPDEPFDADGTRVDGPPRGAPVPPRPGPSGPPRTRVLSGGAPDEAGVEPAPPTTREPPPGTRIMSETMMGSFDFLDDTPAPETPVAEIPPPRDRSERRVVERYGIVFMSGPEDAAVLLGEVREQVEAWNALAGDDGAGTRVDGRPGVRSGVPSVLLVGAPHTGQRRLARLVALTMADAGHGDGALRAHEAEDVRDAPPDRLAALVSGDGPAVLFERFDAAVTGSADPVAAAAAVRRARRDPTNAVPLVATCDPRAYQRLRRDHPRLAEAFRVYRLPDFTGVDPRMTLLNLLADERRVTVGPDALEAARADLERLRGPGDLVNARLVEAYLDQACRRHLERAGASRDRLVLSAQDLAGVAESIEPALRPPGDIDGYLSRLDALTGLEDVKETVRDLVERAETAAGRRRHGVGGGEPLHLLFTGAPGTGKTTVAGLLGGIYAAFGLLESGHVVACRPVHLAGRDRADTEARVAAMADQALGGVLVVQEADRLDRAPAVVDELRAVLAARGDRFMLVCTGPSAEMDGFLAGNPVFRGEFARRLEFTGMGDRDLVLLFQQYAERDLYVLDEELRAELLNRFEAMRGDPAFAYARTVRTLFEQTVARQAARLAGADVNAATVARLTASDLPATPLERMLGDFHQRG